MFEILTSHEQGNASPAMNTTLSGSKTKSRVVPAKAVDSIRDSELDSNEIDESDLQNEKHDEQRISTFRGIVIDLRPEKWNAYDSMCLSCESFSNEIDESDSQNRKHDEQRISTFRGIVIDLRPDKPNAFDSMRFSRESFSNEIDESDLQNSKHDEQRISTFRGIVIDVIGLYSKERAPMRATRRLAAREGKNTDNGTTTSSPDVNPMTVADPATAQTLTPATTT
jgi:heat shock protein HspQ